MVPLCLQVQTSSAPGFYSCSGAALLFVVQVTVSATDNVKIFCRYFLDMFTFNNLFQDQPVEKYVSNTCND